MPTKKQILANQKNAIKGTGPKSIKGKETVSKNAIRHGILSKVLVLPGERESDYHSLHQDLYKTYAPVGPLELSIIDDIAQILWRKRRISLAESADILVSLTPTKLAESITAILRCNANPITVSELRRTDDENLKWSLSMTVEFRDLDAENMTEWPDLVNYPTINNYMFDLEKVSAGIVNDYAEAAGTHEPRSLFGALRNNVNRVLQRRPEVLRLAKLIKNRNLVLSEHVGRKYARYETQLNNSLYKAIKSYSELQALRKKTIDAEVVSVN